MSYCKPEHPRLLADPVTARDHARGPAAADVTVVEYGDFACPFCRRAYGVVRRLLEGEIAIETRLTASP